ncbi:MAG: amidophosphoribosyltransferase [Spirochaetales bacterium]|nr:amidophosphoribosyltransferase [Spirochaetales bacterium]
MNDDFDGIKHYCGLAGIYSKSQVDVPQELYYMLFAQQHRGQECAGISYRKPDGIVTYKDLGMVTTVLGHYLEKNKLCRSGIGHVRYSTHGGNEVENAQPIQVSCNKGDIALAHNGNISNAQKLKDMLTEEGAIFQSTSDSELILHLISRSRKNGFYEALKETLPKLKGAFSLVMLHNDSLIAVRDPQGFRPLYLGWKGDINAIASETCAFDIIKIKEYREIKPGEIVTIDDRGVQSSFYTENDVYSHCIFECIYFAKPDSEIFSESVHAMRKKMGRELARQDSVDGDIVMAVPDSGNYAALGYAQEAGIPFEFGLTRNHYTGRSFILPTIKERELAVRMKLNPVKHLVNGKKIILVDDSLVRGTTSGILVRILRDAGAREVHLRLSSPELHWPCYFGIDIPTREELISNHKTPEEIAQSIAADSVKFLSMENLRKCVKKPDNYCYACFTGTYPIKTE